MVEARSRQLIYWILGSLFTVNLGLVGVVYSNIQSELSAKADKDVVEYMQKDITDIKLGIHDIIQMHIDQGYREPKAQHNKDNKEWRSMQ